MACLVHITLADHPRSGAQRRATTPQSGSELPESSLRGKRLLRGVQTSQAHMDPSIQLQSHPLSGPVWHPDTKNSTETQAGENPRASHIQTQELSLSVKCNVSCTKHHRLSGRPSPFLLPPLYASAQFTALSLYFCLFLMLTHISTSLLALTLSLILSCVSVLGSACAQRMLNMCSGWGLGTADFIGGTLTSHTDRLGRTALAAANWQQI